MASKHFLSHIDLNKNQLLQAVLQNLATAPASPVAGQMYWNTTDNTAYVYDAVLPGWRDLLSGSAYTHPTFTGNDLGAALTGAAVISDVNVNNEGHTTGFVTRNLTAGDIGAAVINDAAASTTTTYSSTKIDQEIAAAVTGGMTLIGDYDASINSPDLESGIGVQTGDTYVVSVAGSFFTEDVMIGDTLISKTELPASLADWIRVERNIPDIVDASETAKGIIELATQAEVTEGTDTTRAVTPATLAVTLAAAIAADSIAKHGANIGDGAALTYTVNHALGTSDIVASVFDNSTMEAVECVVKVLTTSSVRFDFNVAPTSNQYRVVIIG